MDGEWYFSTGSVWIACLWEEQILNQIFGHTDMNRIIFQTYCILLLLVTGSFVLNGQQSLTLQSGEKVVLFCDRTLYIAGEQILFSAFLQKGDVSNKADSSHVLYCELITPEGNKIVGNKYLIENSSVSGYLAMPNDITTGIYYLRAYTKFMRNDGPSYYHYTQIKIVNANRSEVQVITDNSYLSASLSGKVNNEKTGN